MTREIEAKFQVTSPVVFDEIRSQKQVAGYKLTDRRIWSQRDTYLDTATGLLLCRGVSLRLREMGKRYIATFKSKIEGNYVRSELETRLTPSQAEACLNGNLADVGIDAVQAASGYLNGAKIQPVLHVDNSREMWSVHSELGHARICLDDICYKSGDANQSAQEYELEIELADDRVPFLQKISQALSQQHSLIPNSRSKYERGIALLNVFGAE